MNIKSKLFMAGSALLFSATMAFGAITADQLATQYQTDGYSYIQIKTGLTQIKVEAVKDGVRVETIYDIASGNVLDTSSETVGTIGSPDPGVVVRVLTRDFLEVEDGQDVAGQDDGPDGSDDANDDSTEDHGALGINDDSGDDSSGDSADDSNDDNSGSGGDSGGDDGGDDDHGGGDDN